MPHSAHRSWVKASHWPLFGTGYISQSHQGHEEFTVSNGLFQVSPILFLEGKRPAEISSNSSHSTCFRCLIGNGVKLCRTMAFQKQDWTSLACLESSSRSCTTLPSMWLSVARMNARKYRETKTFKRVHRARAQDYGLVTLTIRCREHLTRLGRQTDMTILLGEDQSGHEVSLKGGGARTKRAA